MWKPGFESWDMWKLRLSCTCTKTPALLDFQAAGLIPDPVRDCLKGIRWRVKEQGTWCLAPAGTYICIQTTQNHKHTPEKTEKGGREGRRDRGTARDHETYIQNKSWLPKNIYNFLKCLSLWVFYRMKNNSYNSKKSIPSLEKEGEISWVSDSLLVAFLHYMFKGNQ